LTPQQPRHIHDHPAKIARHLSIAEDTFSDSDSDAYFDPIEYDDETILHGNTPHPSSTFVTPYPTSTIIHVPAPVETINNSVVKDMQLSLSTLQEQIRNIQQKITDIQRKSSSITLFVIRNTYCFIFLVLLAFDNNYALDFLNSKYFYCTYITYLGLYFSATKWSNRTSDPDVISHQKDS
jgi:hypothetical protein